ncbi:c-type cytochrome [Thalassobius vesicularis]|uniref:C-type cytochrome n=1 Tax=Thalassobius vesicularis TaxID=1294297 RepID=A0A4S3M5E2_9RHOB|nr:c-type cytochrome [Thalassobius vesicularis]THD71749.1 c-type cytochrome [Thalassobius vesicularis]
MKHTLIALSLALAPLPALANDATFEAVKVEAGEKLFAAECRRCHATDASHDSYGPPLENVIDRAAGSYPDYPYSTALSASGIVWTEAALRAWMEDNRGFMPGTKMRHVGITDTTVQNFILAYLRSVTTRDGKAVQD